MTARKRTPKKPSAKTCDKLWRELIVRRDRKCLLCAATDRLNAHHLIGKQTYFFRHNPENGVALCPLHHRNGVRSAHANPFWFERRVLLTRPETWLWWAKNAHVESTRADIDYRQIDGMLRAELAQLPPEPAP